MHEDIDTTGLKGTDIVTIVCGKCLGTGIYQGWTGYTDRYGRPYCFDCNGTGHSTIKVSSVRAAQRKAIQERARYEAEQVAQVAAEAAFEAAHPGLLAWVSDFTSGFLGSCASKGYRMSEKMVEVAERIRAEKAEQQVAAEANPIPEGRRVLEGTVVSVKEVEGSYGTTWKMLVQVGEYRVYGSIPASLDMQVSLAREGGVEGFYVPLIGGSVRFTATVERSQKDPAFGFYSRPTKAELLARS